MKHLLRNLSIGLLFLVNYSLNAQTIMQGQLITESCPQYTGSGGSTRLPTYFKARIAGLNPGETYYYTVRACSRADIGTTSSGAGGSLYLNDNKPAFYSGNPNFTSGNFDSFTVTTGFESFWFAFVNSTNARFNAGNYVFPLVSIKSADPASSFSVKFALRDSIKVLAFNTAAGANNGTGIYGTSKANSKDFVLLFDTNISTFRPLTIGMVEDDSLASSVHSAPSFYTTNVDGVVGAWAGILPNTLPKGIRRIERRSFTNNTLLHTQLDTNGVLLSVDTRNPAGGSSSPIVLTEEQAALVPTDFAFTQPFTSISEAGDSFAVLVRRRYSTEDTASINIELVGGTATNNADFTFPALGKTLKFAPGVAKTDTFKFKITDDALTEGNEVITLKLKSPVKGIRTKDSTQSITILDNDVPTIGFATKTILTREGLGNALAKISITNGTAATTTVTARVKSKSALTAIPGEFFLGKNTPNDTLVAFSNGLADDTFNLSCFIVDESSIDAPDTITIVLRNPSGTAVLSADSILTVIVRDNDAPPGVRFIGSAATVNEKDGSFSVSVELLNRNNNPSDFSLQFIAPRSTAKEGEDFTYNPTAKIYSFGTITSDTITVNIPIINDDLFEMDETIVMAVTGTINSATFSPDTFRVTLVSDDKERVTIANASAINPVDGTTIRTGNDLRITGITHGFNRRSSGYEFTVIDATGGIQVFDFSGKSYYTFTEGDSITLSGKVSQFRGVAQFSTLDTIILHKQGASLYPALRVQRLNETTESEHITLGNVRFTDIANWPSTPLAANAQALVKAVNATNDTLTIRFDAEGSADGLPVPELGKYYDITGIGSQNDGSNPFLSDYLINISSLSLVNSPTVSFSSNAITVLETSDSTGTITVNYANTGAQNVGFKLVDAGTGTATANTDYTFAPITVLEDNTKTSFKFNVNLVDNGNVNVDKTIIIAIRNPEFGVLIGQDSIITITIDDDESTIQVLRKPDFDVYPNPASETVYFKTSQEVTKAIVYDINGRKVSENTIINNSLNIRELKPQTYILVLWVKGQAYSTTITKQ